MKPIVRYVLTVFALITASVAIAAAPASQPVKSKYLRFVPDDHGGATLQTSVVRFENADGVTVDLVAAVHIAERWYFTALDESFADYDAVLYEMVAPREMLTPATQPGGERRLVPTTAQAMKRRSPSLAWVGWLQRTMKEQLKLCFQLEEIDYHRPNFVHADLDAETFAKLQSDRGESIFSMMLDSMLREWSNPSGGASESSLPELMMAMRSPDKARQLKMMLGRQFDKIDDQLAGMEKGSVILTERNRIAVDTLKQQMQSGQKKTFAIFFGAGHLKGIEKILTTEMSFHQVGPPFWRVAWDMTAVPTTQPVKN